MAKTQKTPEPQAAPAARERAPENKMMLPPSHRMPYDPARIAAEQRRVMTMEEWERSFTDAAADRRNAADSEIALRQYEGSPRDERNDAVQLAQHNDLARRLKRLPDGV